MPMISDAHIATLTEVARSAGVDLSDERRAALPDLIAKGYVAPIGEATAAQTRYRLTGAGQAVLDERGVGANES